MLDILEDFLHDFQDTSGLLPKAEEDAADGCKGGGEGGGGNSGGGKSGSDEAAGGRCDRLLYFPCNTLPLRQAGCGACGVHSCWQRLGASCCLPACLPFLFKRWPNPASIPPCCAPCCLPYSIREGSEEPSPTARARVPAQVQPSDAAEELEAKQLGQQEVKEEEAKEEEEHEHEEEEDFVRGRRGSVIRYFRLDGSTKGWQRQAMMDSFNSLDCKVGACGLLSCRLLLLLLLLLLVVVVCHC
jgi:hypothetical protein